MNLFGSSLACDSVQKFTEQKPENPMKYFFDFCTTTISNCFNCWYFNFFNFNIITQNRRWRQFFFSFTFLCYVSHCTMYLVFKSDINYVNFFTSLLRVAHFLRLIYLYLVFHFAIFGLSIAIDLITGQTITMFIHCVSVIQIIHILSRDFNVQIFFV